MNNIDEYNKYNRVKYEPIKKQILSLVKNGESWEEVYDFDLHENEIEHKYKDIWKNLVDNVKTIIDGTIDDETIIHKDEKNNYTVPTDVRTPWQILVKCLENKGTYSLEEISKLEKSSIKILRNLSKDTTQSGTIKGMVVGYVQSGKTTSIEGLITMAACWGWNVFIVLSGTIENLRQQGIKRLRSDIEYSKNCNIEWHFEPNYKEDKAYELINTGKRIVVVSLKNSTRLKDLRDWLFDAGQLSMQKAKIIIIDDEADQASLNTCKINKDERSKINEIITDLIDNHNNEVGAMNYVGYTATPYGNFLNEIKSIYPKDFIYMLSKSNKYIGPQEIFGDVKADNEYKSDGLNIKRIISNDDLKIIDEIQKGENLNLPESLVNSICWFIDTLAISRFKKTKKPVSMLIHTSRNTEYHKYLSNAIGNYFKCTSIDKIIGKCEYIYNLEIGDFKLNDFNNVMTEYSCIENVSDYPPFAKIKSYIREILNNPVGYTEIVDGNIHYTKGIHLVVDNCKINSELDSNINARLSYPEKEDNIDYSTGFIIVGGDTLSRGLTIEGLTTTFFTRKVGQMDTLMQMGRWFGYRIGYELLPRIWIDDDNLDKFKVLAEVEQELRDDLENYELGRDPERIGPMIMQSYNNKLLITSKSKSQSMVPVEMEMDFGGENKQTTLFDNNEEIQAENVRLTVDFLESLGEFKRAYNSKQNYLKENVDFKKIESFLRSFNFCKESKFFNNIDAVCDWINKVDLEDLKKWNVIVSSLEDNNTSKWKFSNYEVKKVIRSKKINEKKLDYFDIGVLRKSDDLISDINLKKTGIVLETAKEKIKYRKNINVPHIIIYRINGNGSLNRKSKSREPIKMNTDLIGISILICGKHYKDNYRKVTIKTNYVDNYDEYDEEGDE